MIWLHSKKETAQYQPLESYIDCIEDEKSLNFFLKKNMVELGISIPWEGDFDTFMRDKSLASDLRMSNRYV